MGKLWAPVGDDHRSHVSSKKVDVEALVEQSLGSLVMLVTFNVNVGVMNTRGNEQKY